MSYINKEELIKIFEIKLKSYQDLTKRPDVTCGNDETIHILKELASEIENCIAIVNKMPVVKENEFPARSILIKRFNKLSDSHAKRANEIAESSIHNYHESSVYNYHMGKAHAYTIAADICDDISEHTKERKCSNCKYYSSDGRTEWCSQYLTSVDEDNVCILYKEGENDD